MTGKPQKLISIMSCHLNVLILRTLDHYGGAVNPHHRRRDASSKERYMQIFAENQNQATQTKNNTKLVKPLLVGQAEIAETVETLNDY